MDLDAPVRVVSITPRFENQNPRVLRKRFPEEIRQSVLEAFNSEEGVVNADTGRRIGMSNADFHEHMKFGDGDAIGGILQLEAVAALPDLMRQAKLVESYDDRKGNPAIKKMHRFQAALRIGEKAYSVKLAVKEFKDGVLMVSDENPIKLYHHRLEKEMPAGNSDTLRLPDVNRPSADISEYSLRELLRDVKDSEGQTFFQPTREEIRAGDEALKRDAAAWAGTVDGIAKAGVAPEQPVRMLSQTPLVMRLIGEDAVSKKIAAGGGVYAAPHVFDGTHPNMTPDMWKQLPEAMADPIAIFDTANPKHRGKGDVVFMVEIQDANGATVVVPVALDARGDAETIRINILKSAYAKEINGVPSNEWFKQQVKKNARYVNGQKLRRWQDSSGVYFPFTPLHNAAGNKVVTEADLVKLREANPTLYQSASGPAPFAASPDAFLAPEGSGARLAERFAALRPIEADSAHWFGEGKALPPVGVTEEMDASAKKRLRDGIQQWAKGYFSDSPTVTNADRGWTVAITPKGIKDTLHHGFDETLARSVPFIPQIVESGIYLDTLEKKPGLMSHVFANRIRLDGKEYVVGFVLREDDNGNRFYDHELTQIIDPDWLKPGPALHEGNVVHQTNRGTVMEILRDRLGVKDGSGRVLFDEQGGPSQARGAYVLRQDGAALIALFRGKADISTVIHEGAGHFFLENLREAAQLPDAPAWVTEGWRTVAGAIGADADPAAPIATGAHETFARMAVDYMRSGRAPSDRLAQVFRRFARWLGAIWRRVRRRPDFAEVSPEVAAVMDRLLAAEEDIAATRERVAPLPETAPEGVNPEAWADYLRLARKAESDAAALLTLRRMAWERAVERAARKEARALRAEDPDQRRVGAFAACIPRVLDIQKSCVRCLAHDFFALF